MDTVTGFLLKLIAAVTMFIDHAGLLLWDDALWARAIGRIAFPIYAYLLAEGFRHTHDRKQYFLRIFLLGLFCQIVYFLAGEPFLLGVLLVFSYSLILCELVDRAKKSEGRTRAKWTLAFIGAAVAYLVFSIFFPCDYGIFGVLLPVMPTLFKPRERKTGLAAFSLCLAALWLYSVFVTDFRVQIFGFLALPFLYWYNGKPGKYRLKYFFYIFYPAHLGLLYLIAVYKATGGLKFW